MKFRGVMAENFAMKDFQNVANILSNFSKHCIFRIMPEKVCCIASDESNRPTLWCELPRDYYFSEYRMEGVSSEYNEIFIEFMPAMLYRCLSGSRNAARLLKLKLMNKQAPCLSVEMELPSSGLVSTQQCIHDIPVDVIPRNLWNDYAMPQQLSYDIVIDLPNLKALKNILERMKSMSQHLIVTANKDGRFSLSIETAMTTVTAHFPNRQVHSFTGRRNEDLENTTTETDDSNTVSARVEIKTFYTFLSTQQISYNKAVCCIVRHRLVQLKLERLGAISLQCLLTDI